jgi:4-hydroxybenzoate polyprenyltransferase
MGQFLGRIGEGFGLHDLMLGALWTIGAIAMRGAGCTFNDIVDRRIDAQVARTALRPIPSGAVSVRAAVVWMLVQCGIGLGVLLCLPGPAQIVALLAVPMVAAYPFMKRITWWPQVWLGLTFNWGVLVGYAAVEGMVDLPVLVLFAACAAWTLGYDTIYALQDIEDDALVGVRSTARRFGDAVGPAVARAYLATVILAGVAMLLAAQDQPLALIPGLIGLALLHRHLGAQARATAPGLEPHRALALFKSNRTAGVILMAALLAAAAASWGLASAAGGPVAITPPA